MVNKIAKLHFFMIIKIKIEKKFVCKGPIEKYCAAPTLIAIYYTYKVEQNYVCYEKDIKCSIRYTYLPTGQRHIHYFCNAHISYFFRISNKVKTRVLMRN